MILGEVESVGLRLARRHRSPNASSYVKETGLPFLEDLSQLTSTPGSSCTGTYAPSSLWEFAMWTDSPSAHQSPNDKKRFRDRTEELWDEALDKVFPASDPPSIARPHFEAVEVGDPS